MDIRRAVPGQPERLGGLLGRRADLGESLWAENDWQVAVVRSGSMSRDAFEPTVLREARRSLPAEEGGVQPFRGGLQHLEAELSFVRALLGHYIERAGRMRPTRDLMGGVAVDSAELEQFLQQREEAGRPGRPRWRAALREELDARLQATRAVGLRLPIQELGELFGLSRLELDVLVALAAPEVEPAFERAYCFAWDDFTRKCPTVGFIAELLGEGLTERVSVVAALGPERALRAGGLVQVDGGAGVVDGGVSTQRIRLARRITRFLLGDDAMDELLLAHVREVPPASFDEFVAAPDEREHVLQVLRRSVRRAGCRVGLFGPRGSGKRHLAQACAAENGAPLLVASGRSLPENREARLLVLRALRREARLRRAFVYVDLSSIAAGGLDFLASALLEVLEDYDGPVFVGSLEPVRVFESATALRVPVPAAAERLTLWTRELGDSVRSSVLEQVAAQVPLTAGAIRVSAEQIRTAHLGAPTSEQLLAMARAHLTHRLSELATRVACPFTWDDLVIEPDELQRFREIVAFSAQREKVYDEWGFGAKLPYGRGLGALFHGPPGTGKTMAASIIARELGKDLYSVDLSRVVSKWVGETEKNLASVFDEARDSDAVLLFDEADALFASRTEVRSANDRYANLEVNYLLRRMEDFEGITILTTNFESAIDDAFKRRLRFRIAFPFPDPTTRANLWRRMVPAQAGVAPGIDWLELGHRYELSGGHIKNAVLRAAFLAANRGAVVEQGHLEEAGFRECQEIGKLVLRSRGKKE